MSGSRHIHETFGGGLATLTCTAVFGLNEQIFFALWIVFVNKTHHSPPCLERVSSGLVWEDVTGKMFVIPWRVILLKR